MDTLLYQIWNVDPEIFSLGERSIRWYGLLFASGFLISQQIMVRIFKKEVPDDDKSQKQAEKDVETLTVYLVVATIIGARLGHVLFYEPDKYLANPIDILKIWEGGLASHGAALAIFVAMWLFARKRSKDWTFLRVADRIAIIVAFTGCLIRFGNMMNSEIYGNPTNSNYGIVFTQTSSDAVLSHNSPAIDVSYEKGEKLDTGQYVPVTMILTFEKGLSDMQKQVFIERNMSNMFTGQYSYLSDHLTFDYGIPINYAVDGNVARIQMSGIPRHPTQLYESFTSILLFLILLYLWNLKREKTPPGFLFGIFLIYLFTFRFIHEFFKENQVNFEDQIPLNMGQWLSIPLVIAGIIILYKSLNQGTGSKPLSPQG